MVDHVTTIYQCTLPFHEYKINSRGHLPFSTSKLSHPNSKQNQKPLPSPHPANAEAPITMVTVSVKWQKEVYPAVEIDISQPPYVFKCQLYDLTGVPPERQKIMVKGGLLKDDADWSKVGVKEGQRLMMMGTADEIVKAPEKGPIFVEDMPEEEQVVNVVLRKKYPQFGQQSNGAFMQQDAEECWTQLLYTLSQSLKLPSSSEGLDVVKALFGIEFDNRIHCAESGEESTETETVYSLKCHISQEVNHLHEGLKRGLKSELEKASPSLGRSAVYVKDSRINGLPRYLTIQFVRFFWKRESNQKAKILRKVDYPLSLDVYDLCSDNLRKKLEGPRQVLRDAEGKKAGLKTSVKTSVSTAGDSKMTEAEESSSGSGEASKSTAQEGLLPEEEHQLTGIYDLVAVLTHKGRSADSGHYVAWVKQENGKWVQFDDDNPILQREEDITKLSGGGDWHMAYICMYKARVVPM
ncbi:ubiquitin carboxyl-terminal hydrolase 6 isoform X2 [Capsicum annuum]|uniref:ubiquitin carboxyl-terminal hydrolase 6 isoform X2 n=1 Tax=Capsicum annuum TaxID=4072 RepID=UPI0007BED80C|nr:ubiquitin carboxyl-terminal hydrolase 6 isoform X2 [Capsicum annuum]